MRITIDPRSGYPIYLQIVSQIQRAVAIGTLQSGQQLPTVKQFSSDLIVNPSTVARAMRELERLGVIVSQPGRGSFVSSSAAKAVAVNAGIDGVAASLRAALREFRELGVDRSTVRELMEHALDDAYDEREAGRP